MITFCSRQFIKEFVSDGNVRFVRCFKSYSKASFLNVLRNVDWTSVLTSVDVDFCLMEFNRLFQLAIDSVAPLREIRVRNKVNPWMTGEIFSSIKERNRLFSRFKKDKTNTALYKDYCRVRNKVQRDIKLAKEIFFGN